ncbi:helix-turn-helix domain-containing protein, partial [Kineococcus indalonis]|uniref:helix-turn-helix domain-containing protein n=1 Tax=Kineococcus indalonis TaxID=2696566 RepID=UPI002B1BDFE5
MGRDLAVRDFLRVRRSTVRPEDVGLPPAPGPRRVAGLRREEVASLAGVSVAYYTRLEQGRAMNVSESVLRAVGAALRLDEDELDHLRDLVGTAARPVSTSPEVPRVRAGVHRLLDAMTGVPALALGPRSEVLAANAPARALLLDPQALPAKDRNWVRWLCTDPAARTLFLDWEDVAADAVAGLHRHVGRDACDPGVAALVGELSVVSPDFARWWASQRVRTRDHATHRLQHPLVGRLDLDVETLHLPGAREQSLLTWTAAPGSASAEALGLLLSWTGPEPDRPLPAAQRARD